MWRIARILGRRWRQPTLVRWLGAFGLFGVALTIRFILGPLLGPVPLLSFYPAILLAALLLGWKEAGFVLLLSLAAGWYFFLPTGALLFPVSAALVGALNIAIIIALRALAQGLAEANERQGVLFQELQHRVANTLQASAGRLELIKRRVILSPAEAVNMLDEAIVRMSASADMHRRLNDPALFSKGLEAMFRDVLATVIDRSSVSLDVDADELDLSLDQKGIIAMLVVEVANNAAKHVFQRQLGSRFTVTLKALSNHRAVLKVADDGPGTTDIDDVTSPGQKLGMQILKGLSDQIHGALTIAVDRGREITVIFPTFRYRSPSRSG
jgi:two-component sensor histidine kinase